MQRDCILVVDDDRLVVEQTSDALRHGGFRTACFLDPRAALGALEAEQPSVIVSDYVMPHMDGIAFLSRARAIVPRATRVLCTSATDFGVALAAVNSGEVYRIVSKPWRPEDLVRTVEDAASRAVLHAENERLVAALREHGERLSAMNGRLQEMVRERTENLLDGLVAALDCRDSDTQWHSRRVSRYARRLGIALGLPADELAVVEHGALLHDVGKIGVRDDVLRKPAALTPDEWVEMRRHASLGWSLLRSVEYLQGAANIVLQHHERWDGDGYPAHRRGTDIDLGARIFHVVDAFDAMTSDRPYRKARTVQDARQEIATLAGSQFDPRVVEAFLAIPADEWRRIRVDVETVAIVSDELAAARPGPSAGAAAAAPSAQRAPPRDASCLSQAQLSRRLGELLLELRIIDEDQLAIALDHQRWRCCKLGVALVELGYVAEEQVTAIVARKLGYPWAQLDVLPPGPSGLDAVRLVPYPFASANGVVPVACDRATVTVAMHDPANLRVIDDLAFRTGRRVKVLFAGEGEISRALARVYDRGIAMDLEGFGYREPPTLVRRGGARCDTFAPMELETARGSMPL